MSDYALVAIGYNRPDSMKRLLDSLSKAYYDEPVDLIVSIDNSGTDSVEKCAAEFQWTHGSKKIITYPERMGLRKHILHCGDFVQDYEAVAVFEDDIVAAPGFFIFMKRTVEKYADDMRVAGISLYNHLYNVNTGVLFEPAASEFDVYFFRFAQSWGQVWMKKQWLAFREWYQSHDEDFTESDGIPANICRWPRTSWLKYHIKYCIETEKYFVYPYKALATCFSDAGQHSNIHYNLYQVPMLYGIQTDYRLPDLDGAPVLYDAFFERVLPSGVSIAGIDPADICVDLYAFKKSYSGKRYLLSARKLPFERVASFGFELRPMEMNAVEGIAGNDIFLYDTEARRPGKIKKTGMTVREFQYRWRLRGKTGLILRFAVYSSFQKLRGIRRKLKKLIKNKISRKKN